jgi:TrmH family RNA methyltransferase
MILDTVRVILVRPEEPGNVGGAARALKNFGVGRLVLVAPRVADPRRSLTRAHGAEDVIEGAEVVPDLETALAPCRRAWGTTRRRGKRRGIERAPRDAGRETAALAAQGTEVAWVFGPESTGLTSRELALCSDRVVIPTSPRQPSLNLSHAVAVCLYETFLAHLENSPPAPRPLATLAERHALYAQLEGALRAIGYLHPSTGEVKMAALRGLLERSGLSPKEARFLRGVARQMAWAGKGAGTGGRRSGKR